MKKCIDSSCNHNPITEFDEYFYDHLHPNAEVDCHSCFDCLTRSKPLSKAIQRKQRHSIIIKVGIGFVIAEIILFILTWLFGTIAEPLSVIPAFLVWICYIVCAIFIIKNMNFLHEYETYTPAKTWYTASSTYNGESEITVDVQRHHRDESYGTAYPWYSILFAIILFCTMLVWLIPYIVVLAILQRPLLYHSCPKELLDIYYDAKQNVKNYDIVKNSNYTQHSQNLPKFIKKYDKTWNKYWMLGSDVVNAQIQKLNCPLWKATLEDKEYTVIAYYKTKDKTAILNIERPIYMVRRDKNNKFIGRALVNGYLTTEEPISNLDSWAKENLWDWSEEYKLFRYYVPYL